MDLRLEDKVVLITGASKGLGAAIALAFGQQGSNLKVACSLMQR